MIVASGSFFHVNHKIETTREIIENPLAELLRLQLAINGRIYECRGFDSCCQGLLVFSRYVQDR